MPDTPTPTREEVVAFRPTRRSALNDPRPRFWSFVDVRGPHECWPWTGTRGQRGYGTFALMCKTERAHRVSLMLAGVNVPDDAYVLHSCDNPPCVNPAHLRVGTHADNVRDAVARKRHNQTRKTHCIHGHPLSGDNLRIRPHTGERACLECCKLRKRVYRRRLSVTEDGR